MRTKTARSGNSKDLRRKSLQDVTDNERGQNISTASTEDMTAGDQIRLQSMDARDRIIKQFSRPITEEKHGLIDNRTF